MDLTEHARDEARGGDAGVGAPPARGGDLSGDLEELTPGDAGEVLTLQRAAYVGEAMLYDQFLPPLFETLDEFRAVLDDPRPSCSASATAGA
jgi:hypothetical protein